MFDPTDIDIRREVAANRFAALQAAGAGSVRPRPIRGLGTLLASAALRPADREVPVHPAVVVPSGRTEAPVDTGASLAACT